jgi:RHS repeat-associated protein
VHGKERDAETGLDYFGARYYGSTMGRFTSPDEFSNDTHVSNPQTWNLYAYSRNNPLRYLDPTGQAAIGASCHADGNGCAKSDGSGYAGTDDLGLGSPRRCEALRSAIHAIPAGLRVVNLEVLDTDGAYGIKLKVRYQIVDNNGNPITGKGQKMQPQEKLSAWINGQRVKMNIGDGWGDIGPSNFRGTSKYADANGQFVDAPIGIALPVKFTSLSNQEIRIKIATDTFPVRYNRIVITSDSPGHGKFSNQAGWVGGDLDAER